MTSEEFAAALGDMVGSPVDIADFRPTPLPQPGDLYVHVKTGNTYEVITCAADTETTEVAVIYQRCDPKARARMPHSRALSEWSRIVETTGRRRFEPLSETPPGWCKGRYVDFQGGEGPCSFYEGCGRKACPSPHAPHGGY